MPNMNTKSFSLIEIVVVIVIISIVMASSLFMGHNYIKNLQVQNDKELFWHGYNTSLAKNFSTRYHENYQNDGSKYDIYETLVWDIGSKGTTGFASIYSGINQILYTGSHNFQSSFLTGFLWSGNTKQSLPKNNKLTTKPLNMGCTIKGENDGDTITYSTGYYIFEMHGLRAQRKYKFIIDLESCKLYNEAIYE